MATTFIRVPQTGGAPEDYLVSGAADIDMLSCAAHFNGAAAGVDFKPAIQVLDEAGQVAATVVGPTVTAGGSADVTFAPFLENEDAGSTGGGIQFDVSPQPGNFFEMETVGPSFLGLTISDKGPGGLYLTSEGNGFLNIRAVAQLLVQASRFTVNATNNLELNCDTMFAFGNLVRIDTMSDVAMYLDAAGGAVRVSDHFGNPIFEIREDGSIHGLAAVGAITWDL